MAETTSRLALPLLAAGQAQKEMFHNEALALIDLALAAAVESVGLNTPPATPEDGQCWIVGTMPIGAWSQQANALAGWTAGGWRFVEALIGMRVWSENDGVFCRYDGSVWQIGHLAARTLTIGGVQVVGSRQAAIESPTGGSVVDGEARASIANILTALRAHGLINS